MADEPTTAEIIAVMEAEARALERAADLAEAEVARLMREKDCEAAETRINIASMGKAPERVQRLLPGVDLDRVVEINSQPKQRWDNAQAWQEARRMRSEEAKELQRIDRGIA